MPKRYAGPLIYKGPDIIEIDLKNGKRYEDCVVTELTASGRYRVKVSDLNMTPRYLTFDSKLSYLEAFTKPKQRKKRTR